MRKMAAQALRFEQRLTASAPPGPTLRSVALREDRWGRPRGQGVARTCAASRGEPSLRETPFWNGCWRGHDQSWTSGTRSWKSVYRASQKRGVRGVGAVIFVEEEGFLLLSWCRGVFRCMFPGNQLLVIISYRKSQSAVRVVIFAQKAIVFKAAGVSFLLAMIVLDAHWRDVYNAIYSLRRCLQTCFC